MLMLCLPFLTEKKYIYNRQFSSVKLGQFMLDSGQFKTSDHLIVLICISSAVGESRKELMVRIDGSHLYINFVGICI